VSFTHANPESIVNRKVRVALSTQLARKPSAWADRLVTQGRYVRAWETKLCPGLASDISYSIVHWRSLR
jgi:hypothetical protein